MGYTIHWKQITPVSQAVWDTFIHRALHLIKRKRTGKVQLINMYANPPLENVIQFEGIDDERGETFFVDKDNVESRSSCKTNRHPYTTDVFICLILMFDLGMLEYFSSDDMDEQYPEALEYVKKNYALKRSYAKLKRMGQYENSEGKSMEPPSPLSQRPRKARKQTAKAKKKASKKTRRA
jgi:hypothetical protein